jgi:hypothetical protein
LLVAPRAGRGRLTALDLQQGRHAAQERGGEGKREAAVRERRRRVPSGSGRCPADRPSR